MTGKTHVTCGYLAAVTLGMSVGLAPKIGNATVYPIVIGLLSTTGSLLPDIDLHRSTMGSKYKMISKMFTHRGMTHTLVFPLILLIICIWGSTLDAVLGSMIVNVVGGTLWGWIIHIVADAFNKKGVPIFWPLWPKRVHIASFRTSSWQEVVFLILVTIVTVAYVCLKVMKII